jgi:hypothetical protein
MHTFPAVVMNTRSLRSYLPRAQRLKSWLSILAGFLPLLITNSAKTLLPSNYHRSGLQLRGLWKIFRLITLQWEVTTDPIFIHRSIFQKEKHISGAESTPILTYRRFQSIGPTQLPRHTLHLSMVADPTREMFWFCSQNTGRWTWARKQANQTQRLAEYRQSPEKLTEPLNSTDINSVLAVP